MDLEKVFEKHHNDFCEFEKIENPSCECPDICSFLLLNKLVPQEGDMITAAEHDKIYLGTDCEKLASVATDDDILYLVRCGVMLDSEFDSLSMFV